jgi:hypothetical protein
MAAILIGFILWLGATGKINDWLYIVGVSTPGA